MSKEMLLLADAIAREKDLPVEDVIEVLEESLAFAAKKKLGGDPKITVKIDPQTGEKSVMRHWVVVEDDEPLLNPDQEIGIENVPPEREGQKEWDEPIELDFGRASAQMAKQAIFQKLKDAEQKSALAEFEDQGDGLLYATVKGFQKGNAILEAGRLELVFPKSEMLPKDTAKIGSKIRVAIKSVQKVGNRDVVTATRTSEEFMRLLIEQEVVQVEEGDIEIVKLARAPGVRCKVLVRSNMPQEEYTRGRGDSRGPKNDPARILIGSKGIHAKAIAEETGGEHIDIITQSDDLAEMVMQALSPSQPTRIRIDEDNRLVEAAIPEESLGLIIGSRGMNIRLISEVLGWNVEVMSEAEWDEKDAERRARSVKLFEDTLNVDEDLAEELADAGLADLEDLAACDMEELMQIDGVDEEVASLLLDRAGTWVNMSQGIIRSKFGPASESLKKVGMLTEPEIDQLIRASVFSAEELADLATDELLEKLPHWRMARAQEVIMAARELWDQEAAA